VTSRRGKETLNEEARGTEREGRKKRRKVERQYPTILVPIPRIFSKVHLGLAALIRNIN